MKDENIKKLADLIKMHIKGVPDGSDSPSHNISSPQYNSLYFDIFFDEMKDLSYLHYDTFCDALMNSLGINDINKADVKTQECIEEFRTYWSAWYDLIKALKDKGYLSIYK